MRIDTGDFQWNGASLGAAIDGHHVRLLASWRKSPLELVAAAMFCATFSALAYGAASVAFIPYLPLAYAVAALPLFIFAALAAHFIRCWRRPATPLIEITRGARPCIENKIDSTHIEVSPGAIVEARFMPRTEWSPDSRFVRVIGETQIIVHGPGSLETIVLQFIEYKGIPAWSPQKRLCRRINVVLGPAQPAADRV